MALRRGAVSTALLLATAAAAAAAGASLAAAQRCPTGPRLVCTLSPTDGNKVGGSVMLTPTTTADGDCTTALAATVTGLEAGSVHGWHIHEFGDLSSPTGSGTGGHYNPEGVPHALPKPGGVRHVGDLGNLAPVRPDGTAVARRGATSDLVVTSEVVGRGLIIHAKRDDGGQPTGNAGARLAQCVLGVGPPIETPPPAAPTEAPSTPTPTPAPTTTPAPTPAPTEEPVEEDEEVPVEEDEEVPVEEDEEVPVEEDEEVPVEEDEEDGDVPVGPLPVVVLDPEESTTSVVVLVTPTPSVITTNPLSYVVGN